MHVHTHIIHALSGATSEKRGVCGGLVALRFVAFLVFADRVSSDGQTGQVDPVHDNWCTRALRVAASKSLHILVARLLII